jgi:hypothetical protein
LCSKPTNLLLQLPLVLVEGFQPVVSVKVCVSWDCRCHIELAGMLSCSRNLAPFFANNIPRQINCNLQPEVEMSMLVRGQRRASTPRYCPH